MDIAVELETLPWRRRRRDGAVNAAAEMTIVQWRQSHRGRANDSAADLETLRQGSRGCGGATRPGAGRETLRQSRPRHRNVIIPHSGEADFAVEEFELRQAPLLRRNGYGHREEAVYVATELKTLRWDSGRCSGEDHPAVDPRTSR